MQRARELGLPVRQPRAIKRGPFPEWMEGAGADLAVVVAYGRILTPRLLAAPRQGCVNVHASLLPRYRGAAPIQWSIIRGESETGITTMKMDVGLDTGDMLLQRATPIGPDETAGELWDRLMVMGAAVLVETLDRFDALTAIPQDHAAATHAPMLSKQDGRIDWREPAQTVHNRIRGVSPFPGAFSELAGERIRILRSTLAEGTGSPGTIIDTRKRLVVATGDGAVELVTVQRPGKRAQPGMHLCQGMRLRGGEEFACPS